MSRTKKVLINSTTGVVFSMISSLLSFVLQAVFIRLLGLEYSGINTLFSSILQILNLADMGIGNAILFRLYKTIADHDTAGTEKFLAVYKKVCYGIGSFVGVAGIAFIPFLTHFVKEQPVFSEPLWSLYIIIIATSVAAHLIDYRSILFIAHQDRYIAIFVQYMCIFLKHGLQIAMLAIFKNIYYYLLVSLFTTVLQGIINKIISEKKYHLSWNSEASLSKDERQDIAKDVGSLAVYKFCRTLDATIDTFLISKFVSVASTAIYGSFSMILSALQELLGTFNDGLIAGIGDLYASKDRSRIYEVFSQSFHATYLLYGICTAVLMPFMTDFVSWWIGHTLPNSCVYLLLVNFYMYGMGMNVATFRNAMGLFKKGWKRPFFTAVLNLIFSLVFVQKFGLLGTLLGTLFARTFTLSWYDPYVVCHYGMEKSPKAYYAKYVLYAAFTFTASIALMKLKTLLPEADTFMSLLWHGIVYLLSATIILVALGGFMHEQKAILRRGADILLSFRKKMERK